MKKLNFFSKKTAAVILFAAMAVSWANAQKVTPAQIKNWVGEGANQAILIVNWCANNTALAWGYRFNGTVAAAQMLSAIDAADPNLTVAADPNYTLVNDIIYSGGIYGNMDFTSINYDFPMYNVNDVLAAGVSTQMIADGDIMEWGGCGCSTGEGFEDLAWNLPIANLNLQQTNYTITATVGTEYSYEYYGAVSPSGAILAEEGSSKTFTFTPNAGYHIGRVTAGSADVTGHVQNSQFTIENIVSDTSVNVMFAVDKNNVIAPEDIQYWVGEGANRAILAVNWCVPETAFAWGYKFDGANTTVADALNAVKAADSRFNYVETGGFVAEISYAGGGVQLGIAPDFPMYNVNEEPVWFGINEQTIANNDIIEFGGYGCGLADDFGNEVWTTQIAAVSMPTGVSEIINDELQITVDGNLLRIINYKFTGKESVQILDIAGKIMQTPEFSRGIYGAAFTVHNLPGGVYILKINNKALKFVKK